MDLTPPPKLVPIRNRYLSHRRAREGQVTYSTLHAPQAILRSAAAHQLHRSSLGRGARFDLAGSREGSCNPSAHLHDSNASERHRLPQSAGKARL